MLMLDPGAPEDRREQIVHDVGAMIEESGQLIGSHDWGTRRMTFEIDHRAEAAYHLFQFEAENELLAALDHSLKITDGVLRFRMINLRPGSPPPSNPRTEGARRREEGGPSGTVAPRAAADAPRGRRASPPSPSR